jgi:hypothetical protein
MMNKLELSDSVKGLVSINEPTGFRYTKMNYAGVHLSDDMD